MLIDFITNYSHIMLDAELCNQFKLCTRKDTSSWVMRRVENERTRLRGKRRHKFIGIKCPCRRIQWHVDRRGPSHQNIGYIRVVDWLNHDHLVPWIDQPKNSSKDTFCSPN